MILSASRRTDIPACYSDWFFNRVKAGFALVRNPFFPARISRVSLAPEDVDCIVFWTKNPAPMLGRLGELERAGLPFYFQFTLTPYGGGLERSLPPKREIVETFRRLSRAVGPERVVWRYDPVICTPKLTPAWHLRQFARLCGALEGCTRECVFSFLDLYAKTRRNTAGLGLHPVPPAVMEHVAAGFAETAARHGLTLRACCESIDLARYGIRPGACIDAEKIESITGRPLRLRRDRGQRPGCNCAESVDIGAYDTCRNGCVYCYATDPRRAAGRAARHDPRSPLLDGRPPKAAGAS